MSWQALQAHNVPLILSVAFYALLCVFSIVTGIIYMSGKRKLNPLELPDSFVERLEESPDKLERFTKTMGLVTFVVGIVQGITAYAILKGGSPVLWWIAVGFDVFSICSAGFKLKGKVNAFPLLKIVAYVAILIVLML